MPSSFLTPDIAVDLGTNNTRIYVKGRGIVINEASLIVTRGANSKNIVAIGDSALELIGRSGKEYRIIRPIRAGIIVDYEMAQVMLHYFINKAIGRSFLARPNVVIGVPGNITQVARQSFINIIEKLGIRQHYVVDTAFASALGTGLSVYEPQGNLVVNIGAGTTEIALISLGGIVFSQSLDVAGNALDEAIAQYLKKKYGLLLTERTAEQIKFDLTDVREEEAGDRVAVIRGRDVATGMPYTQDVPLKEIASALKQSIQEIMTEIRRLLEKVPPELCVDILKNGIFLTGGTSGLPGLDALIATSFGVPVSIAREFGECTILGSGYLADHFEILNSNAKIR